MNPFIVDRIFPSRRIHILTGASGSNKTTYLFQQLPLWEKGLPWHGLASTPVSWVYVACDRPQDEADDTLRRVGVDPEKITRFSLVDERYKHLRSYKMFMSHIDLNYPNARLLVIDAFYVMTPNGKYSDNHTVNEFLTELAIWCKKKDITIIGTTHSPKMKDGDSYLAARECILGAIAWGGFASTVMYIRSTEPENQKCPERELAVIPRNGAPDVYNYILDDKGCLNQTAAKKKENPAAKLREFLSTLQVNEEFSTDEAKDISDCSRQYVHRILGEFVREGMIQRSGKGCYQRIESPSEQFFSPSVQ